jgi:hypothetical protein
MSKYRTPSAKYLKLSAPETGYSTYDQFLVLHTRVTQSMSYVNLFQARRCIQDHEVHDLGTVKRSVSAQSLLR